ncbi:fungal pheromone GPCR [Sanghuangporus baumii]|uniref:Fungal pheromone GPCR n=1 Tax=Sanghuangporus baumii TaxID=108892 RepID=A0A9Q5I2S8_SANBA|nr:fungal pheromone GPCR [Sanghuangporus baumii]
MLEYLEKKNHSIGLGTDFRTPNSSDGHYVIQARRYNILEEFGCLPSVVNAWPAFLLMYSWPLIIGSISCTFCARIVRIYLQRRRNISKTDVAASFGRYYRALALGCVDAVFTVPISAFLFVQNGILRGSIESYNWTDAHRDFSRIGTSSSEEWSMEGRWRRFGPRWNAWASPVCAVIFFCFFGLTNEAREGYKGVFVAILRLFGFRCHDKQGAATNNPLNVSQFRAASIERTVNIGDRNSSFGSTLPSESIFGPDDLERMESEQTLRGTEYELPPIGKAALMPLDLRSSMIDQV